MIDFSQPVSASFIGISVALLIATGLVGIALVKVAKKREERG